MGNGSTSKIKVAVLMGGRSAERDVSLSTGSMILKSLDADKYTAFAVDTAVFGDSGAIASEGMLPLDAICSSSEACPKPDVAFIALHGRFGEDGTVQGLLELLEIPYVGSGVLASALAIDKIMTRRTLDYAGLPIPGGVEVGKGDDLAAVAERVNSELGYPVVVKPNRLGSTIGLSIVKRPEDLVENIQVALTYDDDVLLEAFISGVEITVPVLGNRELEALPIVEIVPEGGFYDYHAKYTPGATDEIVPARLPEGSYRKAQEIAVACHKALGCRGMSRTDMIVRGEDIFILEVNTIPGMTPTSLLPRSAQAAGIEFPVLLDRLISLALER